MDLSIAASGLNTAIRRQDLVANNIANAQTPGYHALRADPQANVGGGVELGPTTLDPRPAIPEGSNVDLAGEMVSGRLNVHAAAANASTLRTLNDLVGETLDLLG